MNSFYDDKYKHLIFAQRETCPDGTRLVNVYNSHDKGLLGEIQWFDSWKCYCFLPVIGEVKTNYQLDNSAKIIFHDGCLRKIAKVNAELTKEYKASEKYHIIYDKFSVLIVPLDNNWGIQEQKSLNIYNIKALAANFLGDVFADEKEIETDFHFIIENGGDIWQTKDCRIYIDKMKRFRRPRGWSDAQSSCDMAKQKSEVVFFEEDALIKKWGNKYV